MRYYFYYELSEFTITYNDYRPLDSRTTYIVSAKIDLKKMGMKHSRENSKAILQWKFYTPTNTKEQALRFIELASKYISEFDIDPYTAVYAKVEEVSRPILDVVYDNSTDEEIEIKFALERLSE